jgi:hypothetical protein
MVICFECSRETKDLLDRLRARSDARDYGELIHHAISAYELLVNEVGDSGSLVLGGDHVPRSVAVPGAKGSHRSQPTVSAVQKIPSTFSLPSERRDGVPLQPAEIAWPVPAEGWLFGQLNRILPVKASCRAVANLTLRSGGALPLSVGQEVAEDAAALGNILREYDQRMNLGRDDRFATAFPSTGVEGEKGRIRYATQFVGYSDRQGNLTGLPAGLKLIEAVGEDPTRPMIALTDAGWDWALLPNPVLDNLPSEPKERLSKEESEMLLAHFGRSVPQEVSAYCTLLAAIAAGDTTPMSLDKVTVARSTDEGRHRLSKAFYSTQRSGAISRMSDLNLVTRERDGSRVFYHSTERGEDFLGQFCDTCHGRSA